MAPYHGAWTSFRGLGAGYPQRGSHSMVGGSQGSPGVEAEGSSEDGGGTHGGINSVTGLRRGEQTEIPQSKFKRSLCFDMGGLRKRGDLR